MSWIEFKQQHTYEWQDSFGFPELFVDNVLSKINGLTPDDVQVEYPFKDNNGRSRRVDFMIINPKRNWLLPIELDGMAKMVDESFDAGTYRQRYAKFNDFLERQNAIIGQFGLVLRYSNNSFRDNPNKIINEIVDTLNKQSKQQEIIEIREQHNKAIIADYENKIKSLQQQTIQMSNQSEQQNNEVLSLLQQMQNEISNLKNKNETNNKPQIQIVEKHHYHYMDNDEEEYEEAYGLAAWVKIAIGIGALMLIGILYFWFKPKSEIVPTTPVQSAPVVTKPVIKEVVVEKEVIKEVPVVVPAKQETKTETKSKPVTPPKVETKTENKVIPKPVQEKPKPESKIQSSNSSSGYVVGQKANVCGKVYEVSEFAGGSYLNLNGYYPNHEIALTVWKHKDLEYFEGKQVCSYGIVKEYKGKLSIDVNSLKGIKIQ